MLKTGMMAAGKDESDSSALYFDNKPRLRDVSECNYCINMKKDLKESREELSQINY